MNFYFHVYNYAGRTGRAGRPGKAITFYTVDDIVNLRRYVGISSNVYEDRTPQ